MTQNVSEKLYMPVFQTTDWRKVMQKALRKNTPALFVPMPKGG